MSKILVVDDEPDISELISLHMLREGHECHCLMNGLEVMPAALEQQPDLIVLDLMLPGLDGMSTFKRLRADSRTRNIPVIMLTAKTQTTDRINGLELGADDYLPKTFSSRELLARLRAVLRRTGWIAESAPQAPIKELVIGELRLNPETHDVVLGDQPLQLTPAEFGLLLSLARAHGRVKTREQLIEEVADREWDVFDRAIDMHISTLRKKLGDDPKEPRFIKTVRGYGYQLVTPGR